MYSLSVPLLHTVRARALLCYWDILENSKQEWGRGVEDITFPVVLSILKDAEIPEVN